MTYRATGAAANEQEGVYLTQILAAHLKADEPWGQNGQLLNELAESCTAVGAEELASVLQAHSGG